MSPDHPGQTREIFYEDIKPFSARTIQSWSAADETTFYFYFSKLWSDTISWYGTLSFDD